MSFRVVLKWRHSLKGIGSKILWLQHKSLNTRERDDWDRKIMQNCVTKLTTYIQYLCRNRLLKKQNSVLAISSASSLHQFQQHFMCTFFMLRSQFRQHFTSTFFVQKSYEQLFSALSLALNELLYKKFAHNLLMKLTEGLMKMFWAAFLHLQFVFVFFGQKSIGKKAARKMLMNLTTFSVNLIKCSANVSFLKKKLLPKSGKVKKSYYFLWSLDGTNQYFS